MADCFENHDICPCCDGEGDIGDNECQFCCGYGYADILDLEHDETMKEGWDNLDYTTYITRNGIKAFRQHTNQVVIEAGPSFFDEDGTPIQYLTVEEYQTKFLSPEVEKKQSTKV